MLQVKASGRKLLADKDLQENGEVRFLLYFLYFINKKTTLTQNRSVLKAMYTRKQCFNESTKVFVYF